MTIATAQQTSSIAMPSATETPSHVLEDNKYAPDREAIYNKDTIAPIWVSEFWLWFVNRKDFYVQSAYAMPADYKRGGYSRVEFMLNEEQIVRHLCGVHTIGLYAIEPETNTCKWFCLDADYGDSEFDLKTIEAEMKLDGLSPAFECSRRGGHLWLICDEPLPAKAGRIYLYDILDRLGYPIRGVRSNVEGVEVFPKQERIEKDQYGNGVRAPLGIHRKVKERFWFRDAAADLQSQFSYLRALPRLTRSKLEELTAGMTMPEDLIFKPATAPVLTTTASMFDKFDITRYTPAPRRYNSSKKDYFTQCPCCASVGRDNGGDNLHVTLKGGGPPLFICFGAQCSFKDITEACYRKFGRPEFISQRNLK